MGAVSPRVRGTLTSISVGILIFLLIEISEHAFGPVEDLAKAASHGAAAPSDALIMGAAFAVGLTVGLLGLVYFENRYLHRPAPGDPAVSSPAPEGRAMRLAMMIAVGIGLHNFSEGLAIGASAGAGTLSFAVFLAIGFALHNATEGFGIAAPLAGTHPPWKFLGLVGVIGGGPTFVGTLVGSLFESPVLSVLFLSFAAGALIYVIKELLHHGRKTATDPEHSMFVMGGVVAGFLLGFVTELALGLAGG